MDYRASIAWQPASLEASRKAVAAALDGLDLARLRAGSLAVTGIGASYQAALAGAAGLRARGRRAAAVHPSDLYDPAVDAGDAILALSASGRSRETVEAVRLRPGVPSYALCREAGNALAEAAGAVIVMASGADGGPNTTSYTASLQAFGLLAERVAPGPAADWAALPEAVERTIAAAREPAAAAAALLAGRTAIDCVGAGAALGTAGEASLLLREAVRVPAAPHDTLYMLHGPMESLDARTGLIVFGDGREVKLAEDMAALGCPTVLVTARRDVAPAGTLAVIPVPAFGSPLADAVLQILPAQILVADMADAAGLTDVAFRYRQTDTKFPPKAG